MPNSIFDPEIQTILNQARLGASPLTPSPSDWRDHWIYFLMVDRFNNPMAPPKSAFDAQWGGFQGGTLQGVHEKLDYLKAMGVGAIWMTPVLKNLQFLNDQANDGSYHGYGIQNFLELDSRFATTNDADTELRALVDAAHARGIYIIFDIVLNHAGDVFAYASGSEATHSDTAQAINWRDARGRARLDWAEGEAIVSPPPDATVFPDELRRNIFFRRQGRAAAGGPETLGDFASLKQMLTENYALGNVLIRSFQYLIAKYDLDGFRIDTLKYIAPDFALRFGNAIREFALSVGKKNFFTFGEVYDDEQKISEFIGRNTTVAGDLVGVDAALDFPLFFRLPGAIKGFIPPSEIVDMYQTRKRVEQHVISSHGEATRFFVTFLDNHDQRQRFYFQAAANTHAYDVQLTQGLACLFALPGIPCVYYGTEQGLHGAGDSDQNVREALWGKPSAFDLQHPFYQTLAALTTLRAAQPALRYGRFYFRPLSGDGFHFGVSNTAPGVIAFSRILNDQEVLLVANTANATPFAGEIIVDRNLNPAGLSWQVLYSNRPTPLLPRPIRVRDNVDIREVDGTRGSGPVAVLTVSLRASEVQILGRSIMGP